MADCFVVCRAQLLGLPIPGSTALLLSRLAPVHGGRPPRTLRVTQGIPTGTPCIGSGCLTEDLSVVPEFPKRNPAYRPGMSASDVPGRASASVRRASASVRRAKASVRRASASLRRASASRRPATLAPRPAIVHAVRRLSRACSAAWSRNPQPFLLL